jgi:hypothetical protein
MAIDEERQRPRRPNGGVGTTTTDEVNHPITGWEVPTMTSRAAWLCSGLFFVKKKLYYMYVRRHELKERSSFFGIII